MESWLLKEFFREFGPLGSEGFLERFTGGFLMMRFRDTPPSVIHLVREEGFSLLVGSSEDADIDFEADPTLDEEHCKISFHKGFRGWTIEDLDTSFGTHLDGDRVDPARPVMLSDGCKVKVGGGLLQLQFYTPDKLLERMTKAGVDRVKHKKKS